MSRPAILSLGRKSTQEQDAWCCRNIDRLKSNTLLMVLDHALVMVIVHKSSSVMCPLLGVSARDSESKRKAYEVIAQCVSDALSNIDRQMLLSLCIRGETQALFRALTPHTGKPSKLISSRMSSIFMGSHTVPNKLITPYRHLILVKRQPQGQADMLKSQSQRPV